MAERIEPGKVQPTYSGFLIVRIHEIWGLWREGNSELALQLALRLANTFLLKKIKTELKDDVELITKALDKAYGKKSVDWYTSELTRNRHARRVANHYLGPFLAKMSDLIDEWGYYEIPSRRLKAKDFEELEKNESQVDKG